MANFSTLTDNFNDNTINTTLYTVDSNIEETNEQLEFSTTLSAGYYKLDTDTTYSLDESSIYLELVNAGNQSLGSFSSYPLQVVKDSNNKLMIYIISGTIYWVKRVGGSNTTIGSTTYDSTNHRWLKIRETGGTVYFDYSANGISWSNFGSTSTPFVVTSCYLNIQVGTDSTRTSTTKMIIDNLNTLGTDSQRILVQSFYLNFSGTSTTQTIAEVDLDHAFIIGGGTSSATDARDSDVRLSFTNSTTVAISRRESTQNCYVAFQVIYCNSADSGPLFEVQSGTGAVLTDTTLNVTLTTLDDYTRTTAISTGNSGRDDYQAFENYSRCTSNTNLLLKRGTDALQNNVDWFVIQWSDECTVHNGVITNNSTSNSDDTGVLFDLTKSVVFASDYNEGNVNRAVNVGVSMANATTTTVTATRIGSDDDGETAYSVVQFPTGVVIRSGTNSGLGSATSMTETVTTVDSSECIVLGTNTLTGTGAVESYGFVTNRMTSDTVMTSESKDIGGTIVVYYYICDFSGLTDAAATPKPMKRWNGSAFEQVTMKRWDGAAWVIADMQYYDSEWKDVDTEA